MGKKPRQQLKAISKKKMRGKIEIISSSKEGEGIALNRKRRREKPILVLFVGEGMPLQMGKSL